jgi:hypothetical protein
MNPEFCIGIQGLQNQLGGETGRGFTGLTENSRKPEKQVGFFYLKLKFQILLMETD